ncbi:MAG: hypothetical protein GY853_09350, partial [PVC group bacterium]|nr:hypothetical protein [PVC group bacterium]
MASSNFFKNDFSSSKVFFNEGQLNTTNVIKLAQCYLIKVRRTDPPDLADQEDDLPPDKNLNHAENLNTILIKCGSPFSSEGNDGACSSLFENSSNASTTQSTKPTSPGKNNPAFVKGVAKLEEMASKLKLENIVIEKSKENLKTVYELKKFQGRSLISIVTSVIFASSKQCNYPKNFRDIVKTFNLSKEEKNETMRSITSLKDIIETSVESTMTLTTISLVRDYCLRLQLNEEFTRSSSEIAEKVCEKGLIDGKIPNTVASASIFLLDCSIKRYIDDE